MTDLKRLPGCGFLTATPHESQAPLLTPETVSADYYLMMPVLRGIVQNELDPAVDRLEEHGGETHRAHMDRLGKLGALGIEIPERFGGLELGPIAAACAMEALGTANSGSFLATYGAHTGIGTAPLLYFGTEEQKAKYLPGIAAGWSLAAYALTEPNSGSDALAAKTRAEHQPDGTWVLNGEKAFITNGGLADVFTVLAKADGKNTCFLVERGMPGFETGAEERKHGIRGSSTRGLSFQDVHLPPEALLGEVGKGHKIVLNTLNLGRFKIGAVCTGALKSSLRSAVEYAKQRTQFGRSVSEFGAIRRMIARTAVDLYACESMTYAVAGLLEDALSAKPQGDAAARAIHEYSVECALLKAFASDALYAAADREVQILGGNGVTEDYPAERRLRDSRTIRIFEGTNEVNRLAAIGTFLNRMVKGEIELPADEGNAAILGYGPEKYSAALLRFIMHTAKMFGAGIIEEQEVLMTIAGLMERLFALQCSVAREKSLAAGTPARRFAEVASGLLAHDLFQALILAANYIGGYAEFRHISQDTELRLDINCAIGPQLALEKKMAAVVITSGGYPL